MYGLFGGILASIFGKFSVIIIPIEVIVAGTLVLMSHLLRLYVRRHGWARLLPPALLPRLFVAHLAVAVVGIAIIAGPTVLWLLAVSPPETGHKFPAVQYVGYGLNIFFVMWLWSTIYFGMHYLDNYKQVEIDKWKLTAAVRDAEMRTLKAKINPHSLRKPPAAHSAHAPAVGGPPRPQGVFSGQPPADYQPQVDCQH